MASGEGLVSEEMLSSDLVSLTIEIMLLIWVLILSYIDIMDTH